MESGFSYKEYKNLRGSLAGECQIANLATALEVIRTLNALGISVPETAVRKRTGRNEMAGQIYVFNGASGFSG